MSYGARRRAAGSAYCASKPQRRPPAARWWLRAAPRQGEGGLKGAKRLFGQCRDATTSGYSLTGAQPLSSPQSAPAVRTCW